MKMTLFQAFDKVFHPLDNMDAPERKELLYLKNLDAGECNWSTFQVLLGWVIDTFKKTWYIPNHREAHFKDILSAIPHTQKWIGVDKWHRVLGDLRSTELYLPGSLGFFFQIQESHHHIYGKMVTLTKSFHQALTYFLCLEEDMGWHKKRVYKMVPLHTTLYGYHIAFRYMCEGVVLPISTDLPKVMQPHPSAV